MPESFLERLRDRLFIHAASVERVAHGTTRRVLAYLGTLGTDLLRLLQRRDWDPTVPLRTMFQRQRLEWFLDETEKRILASYRTIHRETRKEFIDLASVEQKVVRQLMNSQAGAELVKAVLTPQQVRVLVDDLFLQGGAGQASTIKQWWARQAGTLQQRMAATLRQGMLQGDTVGQLVQRVRGTKAQRYQDGIMQLSRRDAETLVITAMNGVSQAAQYALYKASDDIRGVMALSARDQRVTPLCVSRDGSQWSLTTGLALEGSPRRERFPGSPPWHFRCLPGDVLVSASGVTGAYKRWTHSDLCIIVIAAGNQLACTPNHPILTRHGWVAAACLQPGDEVVCSAGLQRTMPGQIDNQNMPATIHEVTEAFFRTAPMCPMPVPVAAEDFHGDGFDSDIAIVATNRQLLDGWEPIFLQSGIDRPFSVRYAMPRQPSLTTLRNFFAQGVGLGPTCDRAVCWGDPCFTGFSRQRSPAQTHSVTSAAERNIVCSQPIKQWGIRHTKLVPQHAHRSSGEIITDQDICINHHSFWYELSSFHDRSETDTMFRKQPFQRDISGVELFHQLMNRYASKITLDKVLHIDVREFSGHVYNLETMDGYFTANNIITHNCRTVLIPIPRKGAGSLQQYETYATWLERQPVSVQRDVLGPKRWDLWQAGTLDLAQLTDQRGRVLTLRQLESRESVLPAQAGSLL